MQEQTAEQQQAENMESLQKNVAKLTWLLDKASRYLATTHMEVSCVKPLKCIYSCTVVQVLLCLSKACCERLVHVILACAHTPWQHHSISSAHRQIGRVRTRTLRIQ